MMCWPSRCVSDGFSRCDGSLRRRADSRSGRSSGRSGCDASLGSRADSRSRFDGSLRRCADTGSGSSSGRSRCAGSGRGRCAGRFRRRANSRSGCTGCGSRCRGGRSAVVGDHVHFGDGKAVIGSGGTQPACSLPDHVYVMAQMWLEINTAGSDFESVPGVVFHNGVGTIRATQTTLNVGLVCFDARRGSLRKRQRDQQGRYNHPQECSLHGNPPKILALRRSEISLGICFCFRFLRRAHGAFGLRPENFGASRGNTTTLFAKNLECLFQTAHIAKRKERRTKHRSDFVTT